MLDLAPPLSAAPSHMYPRCGAYSKKMSHCFTEGEPCRQRREVLRSQLSIVNEPDTNPFEVSDSDVEDASDPHLWIDDDQEGDDQDVDVLFLIYWAIEYWIFL